jgi:hypothetical protein
MLWICREKPREKPQSFQLLKATNRARQKATQRSFSKKNLVFFNARSGAFFEAILSAKTSYVFLAGGQFEHIEQLGGLCVPKTSFELMP